MVGLGPQGMPSSGLNIAILIKNRVTSLKAEEYLDFWVEDPKTPGFFSCRSSGQEGSVTGRTLLFPHQQAATRN